MTRPVTEHVGDRSLFSLDGRLAVVTGARRGIGLAVAEALAWSGADVIGVSRSLDPDGGETRRRVEAAGRRFWAMPADLGDRDAVRGLLGRVDALDRRVDILISNAGTIYRAPVADHKLEEWDNLLEINLTAPFVLAQAIGARMAARGSGKIVFTASLLSFQGGINGKLVTNSPLSFGSFHQIVLAWDHLDAFSSHIYRLWIGNSLLYALSATVIVLATAIPAGYGLALGNFPGRRLVLTLTLVVMIMPAAALVLPIFLELNLLHLIGSVFSVILPFAFFPFGVYLAYIYYSTAVPPDLLDAARVDGAGEWQTFRHVALPLAKPIVALVFFFSFVADWNNFFLPYALLANSNQYPIQVGLSDLLSSTPSFNPAQGGGGQQVNIFRPELALATLIAVIPVAIVFLLSQRALVRGVLAGAVKQ